MNARAEDGAPDGDFVAACSFCLKPSQQVGTLVAGPGVYICDACVELCRELIRTKTSSPVPAPAPWDLELGEEQLLATLPLVAAAGAQVDRSLARWVGAARARGITWSRIGAALGMTRQSAWERFSGEM